MNVEGATGERHDGETIEVPRDGSGGTTESAFVHREIVVLIVLCVLVVVAFVLTRAAAGANRELRRRDAAAWFDAGERHMSGGRTDPAIRALRRATALSPESRPYRLALARALAAGGQDDAARQVLLRVRESAPEDPEINLQLARLEARHDDVAGTVRYYQHAVYGAWRADQEETRRRLRIEWIRYLLDHGQHSRALSELLVLSGNLPDDPQLKTEAGQLFLEAGEPRQALERFREALRHDPQSRVALLGAGEAAFAAGDYGTARRYLRAVTRPSERGATLLTISELIAANDPLATGLSPRRQERARRGLEAARAAETACIAKQPASRQNPEASTPGGPELSAASERHPVPIEEIAATLGLIYRIEQQTRDECGEGSPLDQALRLIGEQHEAERP